MKVCSYCIDGILFEIKIKRICFVIFVSLGLFFINFDIFLLCVNIVFRCIWKLNSVVSGYLLFICFIISKLDLYRGEK